MIAGKVVCKDEVLRKPSPLRRRKPVGKEAGCAALIKDAAFLRTTTRALIGATSARRRAAEERGDKALEDRYAQEMRMLKDQTAKVDHQLSARLRMDLQAGHRPLLAKIKEKQRVRAAARREKNKAKNMQEFACKDKMWQEHFHDQRRRIDQAPRKDASIEEDVMNDLNPGMGTAPLIKEQLDAQGTPRS